MEKGKVIDHKVYEDMISLVKCRSILSHEYSEITERDILDAISKVNSVKKFSTIAQKIIKKG